MHYINTSIQWSSCLFVSSIFIYNILCIFNIKMKHPHDTVTKLNAGIYQIFIVLWSIYNICQEFYNPTITDTMTDTLTYNITDTMTNMINTITYTVTYKPIHTIDRSIDSSLIGYFIYDTCVLLCTRYGRTQYIYFVHHILSIYIINICIAYNIAPLIYTNIMYFLMEIGSCTLNWMKLCNEYKPGRFADNFRVGTHVIYFTTRCIALPLFIYDYTNNIYQPVWHQQITIFMLVLLYILSFDWFLKMTTKIPKKFIKN